MLLPMAYTMGTKVRTTMPNTHCALINRGVPTAEPIVRGRRIQIAGHKTEAQRKTDTSKNTTNPETSKENHIYKKVKNVQSEKEGRYL